MMPVTIAAFVRKPIKTNTKYVVRAGPIAMFGTRSNPPKKLMPAILIGRRQ
jgi:hypothetical protein